MSKNINISLTSILQTPQAYPVQEILLQKPGYIRKLIDYISIVPDPFVQNQRECYAYPAKAVQILNGVGIYKLLITKQQDHKNVDITKKVDFYTYPHLDRLFSNLSNCQNQEILLGYIDKVIYSLTKKTPQIYQFFKDHQSALLTILKNDKILSAFRDFMVLFLTQSTMSLYVFLKNLVLRTLMFRIVEQQDISPIVFQMLCQFYSELIKSYISQNSQEDKEQILQVLKNIEEQNFMALLALKISPQNPRRSYFISKLLNQVAASPNEVSHLVIPYIDTYTQYLQTYQQSQSFMLLIMPDQLMMLKLIIRICLLQSQGLTDVKQQLLKRLLVYSNVHRTNSILHTMLFNTIEVLYNQGLNKLVIRAKVIEFLKNNSNNQKSNLNFHSLCKRISKFYHQNGLIDLLDDQDDKLYIKRQINKRKQLLQGRIYFGINQKKQNDHNISEKAIQPYDSQKQMRKLKLQNDQKQQIQCKRQEQQAKKQEQQANKQEQQENKQA